MKAVLLSGGSGKRLWPLSNDLRSKQFIRLLAAEGESAKLSMIERTYARIKNAQPNAQIVIAAAKAQLGLIKSQLGDVTIVAEPERRNTYPAIALACAYLALEAGAAEDEAVVVLPVDMLTGEGYFKLLGDMEHAVLSGFADIVLMGIKPDAPSDRYGYIVPEQPACGGVRRVSRFTEKPDEQTARLLIEQGALWNGGVFAFRLGYLLEIARKEIAFESFDRLYDNFAALEKTSFDYKVVEKAGSVAVLEYDGEWKDIGAWSAVFEELGESAIGDVRMNGSPGVLAVNELQIPLVINGVSDIVVAACPDGILVSGIKAADGIRPLAEAIDQPPMYEEIAGGSLTVLHRSQSSDGACTTYSASISQGGKMERALPQGCREHVTVAEGKAALLVNGTKKELAFGESAPMTLDCDYAIECARDAKLIIVRTVTGKGEGDV